MRDSILGLNSFTGTDGAESNFFRFDFDFWKVDKLETLKDFYMQKSTWLDLLGWRPAAIKAMANPLEYFLKYGGNLILAENALQAGYKFTKIMGGSMVMTCLWELHEISIWSGFTVAAAQLPWSRYMACEPVTFVRDILQFVSFCHF